jgi:hypothetical protein
MKTRALVSGIAALLIATSGAHASGITPCPGAEAGPGRDKDTGVVVRPPDDYHGSINADGATQCMIKFDIRHKTVPRCRVSVGKALRVSRTGVTFAFGHPLGVNDSVLDYWCKFK